MSVKIDLRLGLLVLALFLFTSPVRGQIADAPDDSVAGIPVNSTEARVGEYTLPNPLVCADGQIVDSADIWTQKRRGEIIGLFEQHQFGRSPASQNLRCAVFEQGAPAFAGRAKRTQVTIYFAENADEPYMDLLLYVPAQATAPVPVLLNIAFTANSLMVEDAGVREGFIWNRERQKVPAAAGFPFGRLDVESVLARGMGLATVYYGDIESDFPGGAQHGVRGPFAKPESSALAADEWGAISAWSWGLSRALDYFETDAAVDAERVAIKRHWLLHAGRRPRQCPIRLAGDSGFFAKASETGKLISVINKSVYLIPQTANRQHCSFFRVYKPTTEAAEIRRDSA
ncbi:hypothetical protein JXA02_07940 [candidate division KSB1 bacterium]|nr:hypothetical protein [candidate division KSB1 bacterium]RQW06035.1 MAG: hypothetical protein EH222_09270 [candidate division KSB1 bacterium]